MSRMLAIVSDAYGGCGGLAQANRDLFEALSPICAIDILPRCADKTALSTAPPKNVVQSRVSSNKWTYAARAVLRALTGRYDAIFCGHLHLSPLTALMGRLTGLPYWLHLHGVEAWSRPSPLHRRAAETAGLITCVSRYTRRRFLSWAAVDPIRCRVLPNTYDEKYVRGPRARSLVERYGLSGKKVLLTVGRLVSSERYKGQDRVIVLMPRILEKVPNAVYVIAGAGDDEPYLSQIAGRCGVADHVRFIGRVPAADLPDLYRSSDLFVMPSTGEGFGIVFLEAAACGLPVIGGRLDGSIDALRDGLGGTLIDPGSMDDILKAILSGLQTPGPADAAVFARPFFAEHTRALWSEHFNGKRSV